jgi:alcohol dehydrogenase
VDSTPGAPDPDTARRDLAPAAGLAALFWAISLPTRMRAARLGVGYRFLFMHPSGDDLAWVAARIDAGELEVVVDRVFPFAQASEAMAYLEAGHAKGKVVLSMRD